MIQYVINCPECNEEFEALVSMRSVRPRVKCTECTTEFYLFEVQDSAYALPVKVTR